MKKFFVIVSFFNNLKVKNYLVGHKNLCLLATCPDCLKVTTSAMKDFRFESCLSVIIYVHDVSVENDIEKPLLCV